MERRIFDNGVVLDGCWDGRVRFAFTERTGGVSLPPYASLNLGSHVGDDPAAVAENRRRALASLGAVGLQERLLVPNQVHGDTVVRVAPTERRGPCARPGAPRRRRGRGRVHGSRRPGASVLCGLHAGRHLRARWLCGGPFGLEGNVRPDRGKGRPRAAPR